MYTDGLIENHGPEEALLSEKKLKSIDHQVITSQGICDSILKVAHHIWKETPIDDDVTLFIVRWLGEDQDPS